MEPSVEQTTVITLPQRSPVSHSFLLIPLVFACFGLSPSLRATCQNGCDTSLGNTFLGNDALVLNTTGTGNTATGDGALSSNTTGFGNTAVGATALRFNTTGSYNTATGSGALDYNTGNDNTAIGWDALYYNRTGSSNTATGSAALIQNTTGNDNTANGLDTLYDNTSGSRNVAIGSNALHSNVSGIDNTATGVNALYYDTGNYNTAYGYQALESNTTGNSNTANGLNALNHNTTGSNNSATGAWALYNATSASNNCAQGYKALYLNTIGHQNTAVGDLALYKNSSGINNAAFGVNALYGNTTGSTNIGIGFSAGFNLTTGSNNIDIGNFGVAGESNTIRIGIAGTQTNTYVAGIYGATASGGIGVFIDSNGHLGTLVSSERFKTAIKPMAKASEGILALRPVSFRYKQELDPKAVPQFGLLAEEVEKVNPALVVRDAQGKPYSVRYEAVNAMLLNEFLKEHRKIEDLEVTIAQQQSINAELREEVRELKVAMSKQAQQIRRVSDELAVNRSASQVLAANK